MRLLLFSDLHRDLDQAEVLVEAAGDVDVVIGAGDFANVHQGLVETIEVLAAIDKPMVFVPGNNETMDDLVAACAAYPQIHVLHGSGVTIDGVEFFGIGGGIPITPFGEWSFDFSEDEATSLLASMSTRGVLVSHSPPKGILDRSSSGRSIGSSAVLQAIEAKKPRLVVCGHIHASGGQQVDLDETTVINAGPDGMSFELPQEALS